MSEDMIKLNIKKKQLVKPTLLDDQGWVMVTTFYNTVFILLKFDLKSIYTFYFAELVPHTRTLYMWQQPSLRNPWDDNHPQLLTHEIIFKLMEIYPN